MLILVIFPYFVYIHMIVSYVSNDCLYYVTYYDIYATRTDGYAFPSCDADTAKAVDSDAYCGSLKNDTGPLTECMAKMVRSARANEYHAASVMLAPFLIGYISNFLLHEITT